jgi:hypothetical protein
VNELAVCELPAAGPACDRALFVRRYLRAIASELRAAEAMGVDVSDAVVIIADPLDPMGAAWLECTPGSAAVVTPDGSPFLLTLSREQCAGALAGLLGATGELLGATGELLGATGELLGATGELLGALTRVPPRPGVWVVAIAADGYGLIRADAPSRGGSFS